MWDGKSTLVSRNGIPFRTPKSLISCLPKGIVLDGELWIDRDMFHDTVSVIRTRDEWIPLIKFMVFDAWNLSIRDFAFLERMKYLQSNFDFSDSVRLVENHSLPEGSSSIPTILSDVLASGGEGIMLRDPNGLYREGRQSASKSPLLKVKPFLDDEAEVIDVSLTHGRKGSVTVKDNQGRIFKIGSGFRDLKSEAPPEVGSLITFAYTSRHAGGIPRFPRYIRTRSDDGL